MPNTGSTLPRRAIAFRRCTDADVPFLRHLYGTTRDEELRLVPWTDDEKRQFLDMQFAAQKAHYEGHYPECEFLVIEFDGVAIGRLYIDRGDDDIRIADIALLPEFRGRGIGRRLMEEITSLQAPWIPPRRHQRCLSPDGVVCRPR
jgi:ribosomal protein S18 acetylase RimI-like enzyme